MSFCVITPPTSDPTPMVLCIVSVLWFGSLLPGFRKIAPWILDLAPHGGVFFYVLSCSLGKHMLFLQAGNDPTEFRGNEEFAVESVTTSPLFSSSCLYGSAG